MSLRRRLAQIGLALQRAVGHGKPNELVREAAQQLLDVKFPGRLRDRQKRQLVCALNEACASCLKFQLPRNDRPAVIHSVMEAVHAYCDVWPADVVGYILINGGADQLHEFAEKHGLIIEALESPSGNRNLVTVMTPEGTETRRAAQQGGPSLECLFGDLPFSIDQLPELFRSMLADFEGTMSSGGGSFIPIQVRVTPDGDGPPKVEFFTADGEPADLPESVRKALTEAVLARGIPE